MEETKKALLDQGYNDLTAGSWEQAAAVFEEILGSDPGDGLSCLGSAMAKFQIHGREELAQRWSQLTQNPDFQAILQNADPDFLTWIQMDMEEAREEIPSVPAEQSETQSGEENFTRRFGQLRPEHKLYWYLIGSQLLLYLLAAFFIGKGTGTPDNWSASLAADLVIALLLSGLPMLLSGLYGRSILKEGRFCRVLKILNNIAAVLGALFCLIMVLGGLTAMGSGPEPTREDIFFSLAFLTAFFNYSLALILPMILKRIKG